MALNIQGRNVKLWRKDFDNGYAYSVSSPTKLQDGSYEYASIDVRFTEASGYKDKKISNGTSMDFDGFLSAKVRKNGTKVPLIVVMNAEIKEEQSEVAYVDDISGVDSFEQAIEDIPF